MGSIVSSAENALWSEAGDMALSFLRRRHLADDTIRRAHLGWVSEDLNIDAGNLNIGRARVWIPSGLVIPCYSSPDVLSRVRIRCADGPRRYVVASGSSSAPMILPCSSASAAAVVVVESELDAILLGQELGDLVSVVALGTAAAKPTTELDALVKGAPVALIALDADAAGNEAALFWTGHYTNARRLTPAGAKDPSAMVEAGINLFEWFVAGLLNDADLFERWSERSAIMEYDGGMVRREAEHAALIDVRKNQCTQS
jgi:hypothetical protein